MELLSIAQNILTARLMCLEIKNFEVKSIKFDLTFYKYKKNLLYYYVLFFMIRVNVSTIETE